MNELNEIILLGLNHKTAPIDIREKLAFSDEDVLTALDQLMCKPDISETIILSTCNRVEIILSAKNIKAGVEQCKAFILSSKQITASQLETILYTYQGESAVRHIYRVAASLDSMIIGEPQILGQVKEAYRNATKMKSTGILLNSLFHKAFSVAKRVRNETGIGDRSVSISYAAVELAKKIFGDLDGKKVLLIGAGNMAELAVSHLISNSAKEIYVCNRTMENGLRLAQKFGGKAIVLDALYEKLEHVDIVISSTGSPDYVIKRRSVKSLMRKRKNRPIFFIDIAVPRDIDPTINQMSNFYVYDIDDLQEAIDQNLEKRNQEASKGEQIIDEAVLRFNQWYGSLDVVPTIVNLRQKMETIAQTELNKSLNFLNGISASEKETIEKMTHSIIKKILHDPTLFLKGNGCHADKARYIDFARKLFKLDDV